MTTEGFVSLCHALQKTEAAAERKPTDGLRTPRFRVLIRPCRTRPQFEDLQLERKPIQSEFDWPTSQLRMFEGAGS